MTRLPLASLSLDLDNKWSYLRTQGDPAWTAYPSSLSLVVPRILDVLRRHGLRITVCVVGRDCDHPENGEPLRAIAEAGHEIASHSFDHDLWLHRKPEAEIEADLAAAETAIERVTGRRPVGYRGPGFGLSAAALRVLARRGYWYDASTCPTYLGPLARAFYLSRSRFTGDDRRRRAAPFGQFADGLRPLAPYRWAGEGGGVIELPVTTCPLVRTPCHLTYLLYLGTSSVAAAKTYFRAVLALCRRFRVQPSILLHPTDFLGREDAPDLTFFPGMALPADRKLELVEWVIQTISAGFPVVTLAEQAEQGLRSGTLPWRLPDFPAAAMDEQGHPAGLDRRAR